MWVQQLMAGHGQSDKTLAVTTASASARATVTAKDTDTATAGPGWLLYKLSHQSAGPLSFQMLKFFISSQSSDLKVSDSLGSNRGHAM